MEDQRAVRVVATGRVQGVAFRWFTRDAAETLGVTGWVRNLEDGSVEAHLEGTSRQVDQLIDQIRQGPRMAHVEALDVREVDVESFLVFEISH